MDFAATQQADQLQGPTTLDALIDQIQQTQPRYHDHPGIRLGETHLEDDGAWRYNSAAGRLSRHALGQLCSRLKVPAGGSVPASYIARCPTPLAVENLNHWLSRPEQHEQEILVRLQEADTSPLPTVRAILSTRYARADHLDVLETLRELLPGHRLSISAWSLDDEQLTLRLMLDSDHPASLDDPLRVGLHLSNSEIGLGRISIQGLVTRLVCSNGLIIEVGDLGGVHRRHIGRAGDSLETVIHAGLTRVLLDAHEAARRFVWLREEPVVPPLEEFITQTARRADLPEAVIPKALAALGGDTLYDVVNAFTRAAQAFPVAERLQIEMAMSRFLHEGPHEN